MIPFEALYGRKRNTPISCDNPTDRVVIGPEFLREMEEKMLNIKKKLKTSLDMNKRYDEKRRNHMEFKVGDHILLKVKAKKISMKLGNYSKLAARYCGPFEILERIGIVDYML